MGRGQRGDIPNLPMLCRKTDVHSLILFLPNSNLLCGPGWPQTSYSSLKSAKIIVYQPRKNYKPVFEEH